MILTQRILKKAVLATLIAFTLSCFPILLLETSADNHHDLPVKKRREHRDNRREERDNRRKQRDERREQQEQTSVAEDVANIITGGVAMLGAAAAAKASAAATSTVVGIPVGVIGFSVSALAGAEGMRRVSSGTTGIYNKIRGSGSGGSDSAVLCGGTCGSRFSSGSQEHERRCNHRAHPSTYYSCEHSSCPAR